jgi:multiple sugar transport system ATP-binding protein
MIAGLEEISGGTIRIDGKIINDVEPKNRNIAMVFQNYALYPHMTIAENMGFSLRLAKRPKAEIDTRVQEAARILGLEDYLHRFPKQLSGGQRQRVAMGRAIVRDPQVFLFDEPLSNLDAKLRVQMRAELKDLHARLKTTMIYVTHDQVEAMTMADVIVVMRAGVVEQVGPPLALYDRPANTFVASFIGSPAMNLIEGRLETRDGVRHFVATDGTVLPLVRDFADVAEGASVTYGLRPEHFVPAQGAGQIEARIRSIEPTGAETHLVAEIGAVHLSILLRERIGAGVGDTIAFDLKPGVGHVFDAATGNIIG